MDLLSVNDCIDSWLFSQCIGAGLDKSGHESHLDSMFLYECILVLFSQLHDVTHVQFIECRQHGIGILTTGAAPADGLGGIGAGGGVTFLGAAGIGGTGGGVVGIGAAAAAAGGGGGGGGAAAAGGGGAAGSAGAAAAGLALGAPPAPSFSFRSLVPGDTVAPSSTRSSSITPAAGEGTGTLVLSVSISQRTSSSATLSPTCFSHLTSPSEIESANAGQTTSLISLPRAGVVLKPL